MAWLGEGLSSLSSLKGQITNFTKEVLSDGIVNEIDERSKDLEEANAKCTQLQELLNSKEAERNNGAHQDEDAGGGFFWDPPSSRSRKVENQSKLLQDQLDQATVRIRDLESELNRVQTLNSSNVKDDANIKEEGASQKAELLRAKQDVMNRIIQMGEKSREVVRNAKRLQQDELTLVGDFRKAISKLASPEQYDLIRSALMALENESEQLQGSAEKTDSVGYDAEGKSRNEKGRDESEAKLRRRVEDLEAENQSLSQSIEELDKQNAESIERVLSLKEELQKKHHSLQGAYEQLYVEYNQALGKIENLQQQQQQQQQQQKPELSKAPNKSSLDTAVQTLAQLKLDKETEIRPAKEDKQTEISTSKEDKEVEVDLKPEDQQDLASELKKVNDILKNAPLEPSNEHLNDSVFVAVARQFVELKWKKETLERKLTEQSRQLKETQELRDSLQIDCEDMQTNIESLVMEVQHLKSNLPSIPEASEERVASLETETESLQAEILALRKSKADMSSELKAIKAAIREDGGGGGVELATRIESLLAEQNKSKSSKDPAELLQATLDENTALRRRIDVLESELRVSLERCKGLDENIELIEELKLDLENARRELKIALSNNKRLENSLTILQETKNEVDADNEVLSREKEQLEADLKLLSSGSDLKKSDGDALAELREQLKKSKEEKDDLEYDIRNMRNELDQSLEQLEANRAEIEKLQLDNERLAKENGKLLDQFSETQKENLDKVDLLNTEMTLLQQELDGNKDELEKTMRYLSDMEEKILTLKNENERLNVEASKIKENEIEFLKLKEQLEERSLDHTKEELDAALKKLSELEEKVSMLESENKRLQDELIRTSDVDSENKRLVEAIEEKQKEIAKNEEEAANVTTKLKCTENYISSLEDESQILESKLAQVDQENESAKKEIEELRQQLESERRQKEADGKELSSTYQTELDKLKGENERLKSELDKLLVEKRDVEVNTRASSDAQVSLTEEERSQLLDQLSEKFKEIENLKATISKDKDSAQMARETVENLSQLISSKDNELIKLNATVDMFRNERDEVVKLVQEKHNESLQYHAEIQRLTQLISDQTANLQKAIAEKDATLASLQEKESQLLWTQNELQVVKQRLQNIEESNNHGERCGIAEHTLLSKHVSTLEEKSKAMEAAILQDQSNIRYLQEQLTEAQSKETIALKEVDRLRNHLVEMEANYTEEALQSEEIQRTLQARLMQAEEKLKNSSTMYTSASVRANQQVETLQQQLALIVQQRDDLQNKISSAEDKVLSYSASLTNLQLVLEQFQRDKEKDIQAATEKLRVELQQSYKKQDELVSEITSLKEQLAEAKECLRAASRLTEQLEKKSERIELLNQEVNRLTELVNTADQRIEEAKKSGEGKVDRSLVKNLLLGYISSPQNDKTSVLRVFANVLDFNETEREKSGLTDSAAKNSWFSSLVNSSPASSKEQEASLSSAFIKFLESESQPKPQLPALPISNSPISRPGHSRQHSSSSTHSTLLLSNVTLPTFPDFVPARNTGSILKEVLKDS
ncbi:thyroid receptor-interacting protein 11 isoform X2 [Nasonia vitripennis]|uniref:GRIP domain-containing protein n=1 Tax=Nasonia vitripennis TaxID=7425 RepID=A0A7M7PZA4_NASVI|nr:thyroid receptor-interacting protein 11 isoform X2 [Nasonia vitripennis]